MITFQLASFIVLGIGAQWLAWRLRLPAILLLLLAGFLVGPAPQWLGYAKLVDPNALLGELLMPIVSLSVAVILFEGGLSLNFSELSNNGGVVRNLVSIGAAATWLVSTIGARFILDMSWSLATLTGAILIVTGPTVVGPLLRHVKPTGQTGPILKWEGIVIDPIGAMLTVLVFEAIPKGNVQQATAVMAIGVIRTILIGSAVGVAGARLLSHALRRYWIPDYLQSSAALAFVAFAFTLSEWLSPESGLFAVTLMGILLANQQRVTIAHIAEFKENLALLLVSGLFILLASRVSVDQIRETGLAGLLFTLVLVLVARPLAVAISTLRSGLGWRDRLFLAWMAPRGIVAASVASLFALELNRRGMPGSEKLVPTVFTVIVGTVILYGTTASWVSRRLQISTPNPGFLSAGANIVAREIARALAEADQAVLLVDSNFDLVRQARLSGLPVLFGSVLSQFIQSQIELSGIGRLLALMPNEEANTLAAVKFARLFGRQQVFQLAADAGEEGRKQKVAPDLQGRMLFGPGVTYAHLAERLAAGEVIKRNPLTANFTFGDYQALYGETALPLFVINPQGRLEPVVSGHPLTPQAGDTLISLVRPVTAAIENAPAAPPIADQPG